MTCVSATERTRKDAVEFQISSLFIVVFFFFCCERKSLYFSIFRVIPLLFTAVAAIIILSDSFRAQFLTGKDSRRVRYSERAMRCQSFKFLFLPRSKKKVLQVLEPSPRVVCVLFSCVLTEQKIFGKSK